jgi:hypothetical protein
MNNIADHSAHGNSKDHEHGDQTMSSTQFVPIISTGSQHKIKIPTTRPNRISHRTSLDENPETSYGYPIHRTKEAHSLRIFFQNIKGLSHTHSTEDYDYYLDHFRDLQVDIAGLAETNTAWQHPFLCHEFTTRARKAGDGMSKTIFGSPSSTVDLIPPHETFQAGGTLTLCLGGWTTALYGPGTTDPTGLGRWSGLTLRGKNDNILNVITAYRTCTGSRQTASLGSTFHREAEYYRANTTSTQCRNPRKRFLNELQDVILQLRDSGQYVILMLDANSTIEDDLHFRQMVKTSGLHDLHSKDPAPSTYIGATNRRIDFMLGCPKVLHAITHAGTLSYVEGPQSDHRALYIDLDPGKILSFNPQDNNIQPHPGRALKTGNPELVAKYHTTVLEYYERHKMVSRIRKLYAHHSKLSDEQLRRRLERWDRDQGRAMKSAEKSLRTHAPQKHFWSPILRNAGFLCRYWKLRLYSAQHKRDTSHTISRLQTIIQQHDPTYFFPLQNVDISAPDIISHWKKAKKELKTCQQQARDLRYKSYEELLATYELDPSPESRRRSKIVASTIRTEKCREMFMQIRLSAKPFQRNTGGLTSILIPSGSDLSISHETNHQNSDEKVPDIYNWLTDHPEGPSQWDTVIDRDAVERHLLQFNHASFRAASTSPCGQGVIHDALTFSSLSKAGKRLLQGIIPEEWHGDNQLLHEFLRSFITPAHVWQQDEISTNVTEDDVKRGFGKWKEATSTSPSGRHLGHYRAAIQHPILLECLTKFIAVTIKRGISITRWQRAINVMIEKDPGLPKIHRLRIIHLFEADFNFILKILWGSRLVRRAQNDGMINTGQYGSVPGHTAGELVMLNQLSNDICRTNKINLIRFENDASACYDRILVHLGMLAARRCGMPANAINLHANTLLNMQYQVKTAFGISQNHYSGTPEKPLFGTGQGSGASPAVWLTLVVVLMNTLDRITKERTRFKSPDSPIAHARLIDAFVDDTSLVFNDSHHRMTPDQMIHKMACIAQNWERLLSYSGGSLNLKKCSWSLTYWEWRHGRPVLRPRGQTDPTITVHPQSDKGAVIKYTPPHEPNRILGVFLNPNGDFTKQLQILREKSDRMANQIRSSRITGNNMEIFLRTMYTPAMTYVLPSVAADEENFASVQASMMSIALQKLGASKTTPTAIRHGPSAFGGLNLVDLRTENGISQIRFLRHAIYAGSEAGKLILISLKYSQIEAGIEESLLEHPDVYVAYLTPTWITSLRQFMYNHNITITLTDTLRIAYSGKSDQCIMNAGHLQRYTLQQQRDINLVRLHLQAITLSDISDPDGNTIRAQALRGYREEHQHIRHHWPRQDELTSSQRKLWSRYISSNFLRYDRYWRQPLEDQSPSHRPRTPCFPNIQPIMSDVSPVTVAHDLPAYLSQLPRWHKRLLSNYQQEASDAQVWKAFRSRRRITIASDGGLRHKLGTFGWKIVDKHGITLFSGSGPVDGPLDIANSTRAELGGLTAPLLLCASLARYWGLTHRCKYIWSTDSQAAISKVTFITRTTNQPRQYPNEVDYVTAIKELHKSLKGRQLKCHWVKGHQDASTPYEELSPTAKLNVDVDAMASDHYWSGKGLKPTATIPHLAEMRVTISINGVRYPSKIDEQLRYHINGSYLKAYMQHRNRWNEKVWNLIDFDVFGKHFATLSGKKKVQHMKFVHNLQPLGFQKQQITPHPLPTEITQCPCCRQAMETQLHMLQCKNNPLRKNSLKQFHKDCCRKDGNRFPQIFADLVGQWLLSHNHIPSFDKSRDTFLRHDIIPIEFTKLVQQAITDQTMIGWIHATRGILAKTWKEVASMAYDGTGKLIYRPDGEHRMRQVLKALHHFTTAIWAGRNSALHTSDKPLGPLTIIDANIVRYHREPEQLMHGDSFYCEQPLYRLLSSSDSIKRRWLHRVQRSREKKANYYKDQTQITKYFSAAPRKQLLQLPKSQRPLDAATTSGPKSTSRSVTVQRLMTFFLHERAPNKTNASQCPSPPPSHSLSD